MKNFLCIVVSIAVIMVSTDTRAELNVVTKSVTPYYMDFIDLSIPSGYINKGDTLRIDSMRIDTAGKPWFEIQREKETVYVNSSDVEYIIKNLPSENNVPKGGSLRDLHQDSLRRERIMILREHRDWPVRIKRLVRKGNIALDMTYEQVEAAWDGEPLRKTKGFVFGMGDVEFCFYGNEERSGEICVIMKKGRVVGWSVEESE